MRFAAAVHVAAVDFYYRIGSSQKDTHIFLSFKWSHFLLNVIVCASANCTHKILRVRSFSTAKSCALSFFSPNDVIVVGTSSSSKP